MIRISYKWSENVVIVVSLRVSSLEWVNGRKTRKQRDRKMGRRHTIMLWGVSGLEILRSGKCQQT